MNALEMPPLAVMDDDDGIQMLVVPVGLTILSDARVWEIAPIWVAKQSAN
jgi:hypothetical protein